MELAELITSNDFKKTQTPNKVRYCCPFCGDDKFKFVIDFIRKNFVCWRCGKRGSLKDEIPTTIDSYTRKVQEFRNGKPDPITGEIKLPNEALPITRKSGTPFNYLLRRGLDEYEIKRYSLRYCSDGEFKERIILPVFEDGHIVYFIGRTYTSLIPKYLNCKFGRSKVVFRTFEEEVDACVLVEGAFDAISVGRVKPAVSLLGKVCSRDQARKIASFTKKVYVMLDKDAKADNMRVNCGELNYYVETCPIFINRKDPGCMTPREIKEAINGTQQKNRI